MNIPVAALQGLVIYPEAVIHFDLTRKKSIAAAKAAMKNDGRLLTVSQKDISVENPGISDLYTVGTIIQIKQLTKMPGGIVRLLAEGVGRAKLHGMVEEEKRYLLGAAKEIFEIEKEFSEEEIQASYRVIYDTLSDYSEYYPRVVKSLEGLLEESMSIGQICFLIAMNVPLPYEDKQAILEEATLDGRFLKLINALKKETNVSKFQAELSEKIKDDIQDTQKKYILREQMEFLRKELSEENGESDIENFLKQLEELNASEEIKQKIKKEIKRFDNLSEQTSEGSVQRMYIEALLELPWNNKSIDNPDIKNAERILNADHYGMEKVKERILEFLAVRAFTEKGTSPIICLVGPPGTGKTSIARSIARALNKEYVRICLGGVRDEAEIRGHRRTYVGAMAGRIAEGLKNASVANPLMLLDEIDKVSNDYKGDTFSALLEVLDPDQNKAFRDHYIELPLDLSEVLFIATANDTSNIPRPLLDRMEIVEVSGYTANEKFHIAKNHLMKKQFALSGMNSKMLSISDGAVKDIISYYTREAGVRGLEKKIGELCRKAAKERLENTNDKIVINSKNLSKYLGKRKYTLNMANRKDEIGIVTGLAWTAVGGDTLEIEVNTMPGKGNIKLTGQMGDVMKESASIAMSYVRSIAAKYGVEHKYFAETDFHIHIPEGAVPKDGPSAGITMATAIFSAITGKKVASKTAMTGEVTLRGKVLPVGGLKEKLLAANTAGIKKVLVPKENEKDIEEFSTEIIGDMELIYASDMKEVLKEAIVW